MGEVLLSMMLQLGKISFRSDSRAWLAIRCTSKALHGCTEHPMFAKLMPHQQLHFLKLEAALVNYGTALDLSTMGYGKSYTASAMAKVISSAAGKTVVWGPPSSELNWRQSFDHFELGTLAEFYSYTRVQAKKAPYVSKVKRQDNKLEFQVHADWQNVALLILDEVQWLINPSQRSDAIMALIRALPANAKVLCLSGTPLRHIEQSTQLARLLRIVKHKLLAQMNLQTRQLELLGLRECFDFCERLEPTFTLPRTGNVWNYDLSCVQALHYCLSTVIKQHIFFAMPEPKRKMNMRSTFDLYFDAPLPQLEQQQLHQGIGLLRNAVARFRFAGAHNHEGLSMLTQGLKQTELAKVPLFVQFAEHALLSNPDCKVLLMVHWRPTLEVLQAALAHWQPLCVSSKSTTLQRRNRFRSQFQAQDNSRRLLISTAGLLATGCDLDDQSEEGSHPRIMGISPLSQKNDVQVQVAGRIDRLKTSSQASVFYLFSNEPAEKEVLEQLSTRSSKQGIGQAQLSHTRISWSQLEHCSL